MDSTAPANSSSTPQHVIEVGTNNGLFVDGLALGTYITRKEEALLRAIMLHSHVAAKSYLMTALYEGRDEPAQKIVDVFVTKVRAKLGVHRDAIETVWGRGYVRGDGYTIAPAIGFGVAVGVEEKLAEDIVFACGEPLHTVVDRLLRAEYTRVWATL